MKCYRVYVNGEIVATLFNLAMVAAKMDEFFKAGFENVEFKIEEY